MATNQQLVALQSQQLKEGMNRLDINLSSPQRTLLIDYLQLLNKWNKAFNLTAVRHPEEHVSRHLLDSLALLPLLAETESTIASEMSSGRAENPVFLDVGTGPGLPGIPLAIAMPRSHWYLLDSNGKKIRFITQCKMDLGLSNIETVYSRVESFQLPVGSRLDGITSRAFSTLKAFVTAADGLVTASQIDPEKVRLYAMKGVFPKNEVSELPNNYKIHRIEKLSIPNSEGERHVIVLSRAVVSG